MPRSIQIIVALALSALAACGGGQASGAAPAPPATASGPPVALSAPALDGGIIDVASYRGQSVVIHLFAPSEPRLATDVEQLRALDRDADLDVVVIGFALEPGGYPIVSAWRRAMDVDYLLALTTSPSELQSSNLAPLSSLPTTLLLDPQGRLIHRVDRLLEPGELRQLVSERKTRD